MLSFIWPLDDFETSWSHFFKSACFVTYVIPDITNLLYLRKSLSKCKHLICLALLAITTRQILTMVYPSTYDQNTSLRALIVTFEAEESNNNLFCFTDWQMFSFDHLSGEQKPLSLARVNHWPIYLAKWRNLQLGGETEDIYLPLSSTPSCVFISSPFPL